MKSHYKVRVSGKVQGVFFRASARQTAELLGVVGFVQNEDTGDVYLEVEGDETVLAKFLEWCRKGPDRSEVKHVHVQPGNLRHFTRFEIRK